MFLGFVFLMTTTCNLAVLMRFENTTNETLNKYGLTPTRYSNKHFGSLIKYMITENVDSAIIYDTPGTDFRLVLSSDGKLEIYDPDVQKTNWFFVYFRNNNDFSESLKRISHILEENNGSEVDNDEHSKKKGKNIQKIGDIFPKKAWVLLHSDNEIFVNHPKLLYNAYASNSIIIKKLSEKAEKIPEKETIMYSVEEEILSDMKDLSLKDRSSNKSPEPPQDKQTLYIQNPTRDDISNQIRNKCEISRIFENPKINFDENITNYAAAPLYTRNPVPVTPMQTYFACENMHHPNYYCQNISLPGPLVGNISFQHPQYLLIPQCNTNYGYSRPQPASVGTYPIIYAPRQNFY